LCFRIEYPIDGDTYYYRLSDSNVGIISKTESEVKIGVVWKEHNHLLEKELSDAIIIVFMDIENEIKGKENDGHMEFAFGFSIHGTSLNIVNYIDPSSRVGMKITPYTPITGGTNTNS
jgi:hypothetical protein